MRFWSWLLLTTLVGVVPQSQLDAPAKPNLFPKIQLNDNHQPAGHLAGGVLKLSLVSDTGCDVEPRARLRAPLVSARTRRHRDSVRLAGRQTPRHAGARTSGD